MNDLICPDPAPPQALRTRDLVDEPTIGTAFDQLGLSARWHLL